MSQDQFDKWLKSEVNNVKSDVDLDGDWSAISQRLEDDRKRRRGGFWWWTSAATALAALILGFYLFLPYNNLQSPVHSNSSKSSIDNHSEEVDKTTIHSESNTSPSKKTEVGEEKNQIKKDQHIFAATNSERTGSVTKSNDKKVVQRSSAPNAVIENEPEKGFIRQEKKTNKEEATMTDIQNNQTDDQIAAAAVGPEFWQTEFLDAQTTSIKNSNELLEIPSSVPSFSRPIAPSMWRIQMGIAGGTFVSDYSLKNSEEKLDEAFASVEKEQESVNFRLQFYRQLSRDWEIGVGARAGYRHLRFDQDFTRTQKGQMDDELIRVIEDFDGTVTNISGTANGMYTYEVQRKNHQMHWDVSVPVVLRKNFMCSRGLSIGVEAGVAPGWTVQRTGTSIISSAEDLQLQDISTRYDSQLRGSVIGGAYASYHLTPTFSLYGGIGLSFDVIGQKSTSGAWKQHMHDGQIEIGISKRL